MPAADLTRLLRLEGYEVRCIDEEDDDSVTLFVDPLGRYPVCSGCGQCCMFVHATEERTVRHLDVCERRCIRDRLRVISGTYGVPCETHPARSSSSLRATLGSMAS